MIQFCHLLISNRYAWAGFCVLAMLAIRLMRPMPADQNGTVDPDHYLQFARAFRSTGTIGFGGDQPQAYRPPLYIVVLASCLNPDGSVNVWLLHLVHLLSTLAIMAGTRFMLASLLPAGDSASERRLERLTLVMWSIIIIQPNILHHYSLIFTETLFTGLWTLAIGGTVWLHHRRAAEHTRARRLWAAIGILVGLACLTRPTGWILWLATGIAVVISSCHSTRKHSLRNWLIASGLTLLVVSPWMLRNWYYFGEPIVTTTHGGMTLWLGMNPSFYQHEVLGHRVGSELNAAIQHTWPEEAQQAWRDENDRQTKLLEGTPQQVELARDQTFHRLALAWIGQNPLAAVRTAFYHLQSFWRAKPVRPASTVTDLVAWFYFMLYFFATVGGMLALRRRHAGAVVLIANIMSLSLLHAVMWSNIRMRMPIEPMLTVLAISSLAWLMPAGKPATADHRQGES